MARMIPDIDPATVEHGSEEPVYRALRDQLSDDHLVLHSYPWLRPWRDNGALAEGEADFVVLHPEKGMLVLEVKGGESIRHDGKRWYRQTRNGLEEFKDPFVQARRNVHALLDIARERSGGRIRKDALTYGYAAVFPHVDYEGHTPPNADPTIVISRRHLPYLEQAIETAYRAWTTEPRVLRSDHYRMLVEDCLMPQFGMFKPVGADIDGATQRLLELTEHQAQVFEGLYAQDRVVVEGVAGSGKTFLALQRALSFARAGKRTLMVCYNRELAAWLRHQVESDPSTVEFRHLLVIRNFHALASQLAAQARIPFRTANGGPQTENFWDNEVPDLLEQAVLALETDGADVRYNALVVDEAQDFPTGWWY
ncbi:MAG TPA: NERD domain-containing protein, partial [Longimicrobium sp.]